MNTNENRVVIKKCTPLKNSYKVPDQKRAPHLPVFGEIFSNFELSCLYNGPVLKILNVIDGSLISSWDFSTVTRDNRTKIIDVVEYQVTDPTNRALSIDPMLYFIVSYVSKKDSSKVTYLSLCHPRTSQILHTITTKERITRLTLISVKKDHSSPISGVLKRMCGILGAGTKSGKLLFIDITQMFGSVRRSCSERIKNRFSEMVIVDYRSNSEHVIKEKFDKTTDLQHIVLSLPITDDIECKTPDMVVNALKYLPECSILAVGLKSGVIQLWNVTDLNKLYESNRLGDSIPVAKFAFQEPCNDPQNVCYLWVLYESESESNPCLPFAIMYVCLFKKVTTIPECGRVYKDFMSCSQRFDVDVDLERCVNGRCIACGVVSNTTSNFVRHISSADEDSSKINLFVAAFETWERKTEFNSFITLIVFDMNQWYKAQMPFRVTDGYTIPFIDFQIFDLVSECKGSVKDMLIHKDSIQQFLSFNLSEEYSYPSSLSFDILFLSDTKLTHVHVPGAQRNVLDKIVNEGPLGIVNPNKYYSELKEVNLKPCFSETYSHVIVPSQLQQRNFILTVLLEHKLSFFLVNCIKQWADGSRVVSGCTLLNLIQWAWECVTRIKHSTDTICIPLFDYSGDDLDRENYQKLNHCVQLIFTLRDLLAYILKNYKQYLLDTTKLNHQVDTLKLITKYFEVIIWCLDSKLLPEKVTSSSDNCVPTYMMSLMQYSEQRREELKIVASKGNFFDIPITTLYIIDSILENDHHGRKLRKQWERESGGIANGLYPPVTLQSLVRMFLLPDFSMDAKHFIMIYFLLDVCDYHRDEDIREQLHSFGVVFSIDNSLFALVQACWFIDHEKFEEAWELLRVDSVMTQLKSREHLYKTIMMACVCQGQYGLALKTERLAKMSSTVFKDKSFFITLLLLNGLVLEAYRILKENAFGQNSLWRHFFKICDHRGYLKEVFKFPLLPEEDEEFIKYLDECENKDAGDLKVMYLLSRARYVEAIDVNDKLNARVPKFGIVGRDTTTQVEGVGRTATRDMLVNAFRKTLPSVKNDLIDFCKKERSKISRFKAVAKPTPLSVVIHTDFSHQIPIYKSSFESVMEAAICKTAETWSNVPEMVRKRRANINLKDTPFLRSNMVTPRKNQSFYAIKDERDGAEKKGPSEPATKKMKLKDEHSSLVQPAEVINLLCTPHVQKRLNKLLESTPEASPLTSILKSAEAARFKQPQRVGFSMPEKNRNQTLPQRASVISPAISSCDANGDEKPVKKCLDFESAAPNKPQAMDTEVEIAAAVETSNMSENISLDTSVANCSFYSLDSDAEVPRIEEFVRNAVTPSKKLFIESMSEEEVGEQRQRQVVVESVSDEHFTKASRKFTIESMSDEEIFSPMMAEPNVRDSVLVETPADENQTSVQLESEHPSTIVESTPLSKPEEIPSLAASEVVEEMLPYQNPVELFVERERSLSLDTYERKDTEDENPREAEQMLEDNSATEVGNMSTEEDSDIEVGIDVESSGDDESVESVEEYDEESEAEQEGSDVKEEEEEEESVEGEMQRTIDLDDDDTEVEEETDGEAEISVGDESNSTVDDEEEEEEEEEDDEEEEEEEGESAAKEIVEEESPQSEAAQASTNASIDYDMLQEIMNTVAATSATCEIQEQQVEEIVGCGKDESTIGCSSKIEDTSVEFLSVSTVEKEMKSDEPQLIFFFGENSVTSISDELLRNNESMEVDTSKYSIEDSSTAEQAQDKSMGEADQSRTKDTDTSQSCDVNDTQGDYSILSVEQIEAGSMLNATTAENANETQGDYSIFSVEQIGTESMLDPITADTTAAEGSVKQTVVEESAFESSNLLVQENYRTFELSQDLSSANIVDVDPFCEFVQVSQMRDGQQLVLASGESSEPEPVLKAHQPSEDSQSTSKNLEVGIEEGAYCIQKDFNVSSLCREEGSENTDVSGASQGVIVSPRKPPPDSPKKSIICTPTKRQRSPNETFERPLQSDPLLLLSPSPRKNADELPETTDTQAVAEAETEEVEKSPVKIQLQTVVCTTSASRQQQSPLKFEQLIRKSTSNAAEVGEAGPELEQSVRRSARKTSQSSPVNTSASPQKIAIFEHLHRSPRAMSQSFSPSTIPGSPHKIEMIDQLNLISTTETAVEGEAEKPESVSSFTLSLPNSPQPPSAQVHESPVTPTGQGIQPDPTLTGSRRSARIASRGTSPSVAQSLLPRPRKRRSISNVSELAAGDCDTMSVKSAGSAAESISSRVSVESAASVASSMRSQRRKRSLSNIELRKTSSKPQFKQLQMIVSDEEEDESIEEKVSPVATTSKRSAKRTTSDGGTQKSKKSKASTSDDQDRLSSTSATGTTRKSYRTSKSESNNATLQSPAMQKKKKKIICSTPMVTKVSNKPVESTPEVKMYAESRRLTRYQQGLLNRASKVVECGGSQTTEYSSSEEDEPSSTVIEQPFVEATQIVKPMARTRAARTTPLVANKFALPVISESSDESFSSKASTTSRKSKTRLSTFTNLELRQSTVRPKFKPLAPVQSDEESFSHTPNEKSIADEESSLPPSPMSIQSRQSCRRSSRLYKKETEHSDKESSISEVSSHSNSASMKKTRRSIAFGEASKTCTEFDQGNLKNPSEE